MRAEDNGRWPSRVRSRHRRRRRGFHLMVAGTVAVLAALAAGAYVASSGPPAAPSAAAASSVPAAAREWCPVTGAACAAYPPPAQVRGITVASLESYVLYIRSARLQVAAAPRWHANTIRFQIVQDRLVGATGRGWSPRYAAAIRTAVHYALARHLTAVLNAQTEPSIAFPENEPLPTAATYSFWRHLIALYGRNPHVVFDLFNEPRLCTWPQWRAAFQPLVNYVRASGSRNELWAEGIDWGSTLDGVPFLHGRGIVYTYHHPGAPWQQKGQVPGFQAGVIGPALWDRAFGNLAAEGVPVVDGEFVNYLGGYDFPNGKIMVSAYLRYLAAHHIGIVGWSLQPGIMTTPGHLTVPAREPQSAGRLIWLYYHGQPMPPWPRGRPVNEIAPPRWKMAR